jgi:hypothetical protein
MCEDAVACKKTFGTQVQTGDTPVGETTRSGYTNVQTDERSAADYASFKSGNAQYNYVKNTYVDNNIMPKFKSHADYLAWKRMTAQLYSKGR